MSPDLKVPATSSEYAVHESIIEENEKIRVRTVVIATEESGSESTAVLGDRNPEMAFSVLPMGAPRMVRSDKWRKRPVVLRYFDYRAQLQLQAGTWVPEPHSMWLIFLLPMPESWTNKKKTDMRYAPHQQKPDKDNLEKGFLDAFGEDQHIWDGRVSKIWVPAGQEGILVF